MFNLWSPLRTKDSSSWESSSTHKPAGTPDKEETASSAQHGTEASSDSPVAAAYLPPFSLDADSSYAPLSKASSPELVPESMAHSPEGWLGFLVWLVKCTRGMALAQMSFLWLLATITAAAACGAGACLLGFLIITRRYAPATLNYVRPLHFDYASKDGRAVAISPLVQGHHLGGDLGLPALPGARFLPSGQQIELWVELTLPETDRNQGIFQLSGELLMGDSRVVARSTRPFMLKHQSSLVKLIRTGIALPWAVLGLYDESVKLRLHLFDAFEERDAYPVAYFRATLLPSSSSSPLPLLYDAAVHVRLKLGLVQRVLYWLRPSMVMSWLLALSAVVLLAWGSSCGLLLLGLAALVGHIAKQGAKQVQTAEPVHIPLGRTKLAFQQLAEEVGMPEIESKGSGEESLDPLEAKEPQGMKEVDDDDTHYNWVDASSSRSRAFTSNPQHNLSSDGLLRRKQS